MGAELKFKNGSYIKTIESSETNRPTDIKFKEVTDVEIAEMFNMSLEEFKKEVEQGKIKCLANLF